MPVHVFFDPHRVAQLRQQGIAPPRRLSAGPVAEAAPALGAVEECARLRAEVARLRRDNQRLTDEVARLSGTAPRQPIAPSAPQRTPEARDLDDAAQRFALLELDR